jgi:outer membrane protein assembly factor BamB
MKLVKPGEDQMRLAWTTTLILLTIAQSFAGGNDWPAFRGPNGTGICDETNVPTTWGPEENIAWKAKLPQPSNGSPIVAEGRVFVAGSEDPEGKRRSLYCFDRHTGKQLWVKTVNFDKVLPRHETNPHGSSTPASDGQRVVVWHASAGLHCYSMDGRELWSKDLGEFKHMWGDGTSPFFYDGKIILHTGPGARVYVTAIDPATGRTIWEQNEPIEGNGEQRNDEAPMGSWSTPVVATANGKDMLISMMPTRVNAYDPETGEILWTCEGIRHKRGDLAYSSPIVAGDLCFVTGGYQGPSMTIRITGSGNITDTHRLWRKENSPQSIGSGVFIDGHIYRPNAGPGTIECIDPEKGEVVWTDRAAGGEYWGSIVVAGGLCYVTDKNGTTVVFKPNPKEFEKVAFNELGEPSNSTPAISDGQIFIRTANHLFCIGRK